MDSILIEAQPYAITSLQPAILFWLDQGSSINCAFPPKHNVAGQEAVSLKAKSGFSVYAGNVIIHQPVVSDVFHSHNRCAILRVCLCMEHRAEGARLQLCVASVNKIA
jgi:hypothetical protein